VSRAREEGHAAGLVTGRARVVVTGSQGFVGRHLRAALAARGADVIGVGRPGSGAEVEVDLAARELEVEGLVRALGPVDGVVWLAATITRGSSVGPEARENVRVIALRAAEWMEAAHALAARSEATPPHFVLCSSLKMYGPADGPIDPMRPPRRPDPWSYGCAKLLAERLLEVAAARRGASWCTVRPTYVYGPGQHLHNAIPRFLAACWAGERPVVFGAGNEVRDDVYVRDVAWVLAEACLGRVTGALHAASGQAVTLLDVARACCRAVEALGGPAGLEPRVDPSRPTKWWLDQRFDLSRTVALLGHRPTPLAEGLRREAAWIRDGARAEDAVGAAAPRGADR
jgi:UDP-glucose 4-epimerase